MSKKKKVIILSCMILLLAATAVLNYVLTNNPDDSGKVTTASYFDQYRTERSQQRNEQILQLDAIISASESASETYTDALNEKLAITKAMETELLLENLIKAMGFDDVVVSIGTESENVNVIVKDSELDQTEAVAIYTILQSEAKATPDSVRIIPIS